MPSKLTTDGLLLELSLYNKETIDDIELINNFFSKFHTIQFDCFCIHCEKDSTFKKDVHSSPVTSGNRLSIETMEIAEDPKKRMWKTIQGGHTLDFQCQRNANHVYSFYFKVVDDKIIKVGQYPSVADLELHKIQKYRSLLKDDYKDFSKAIGLYSHGIGAGSYVYLRRIFENLIVEQKDVALQTNTSLSQIEFDGKRMDEKIQYIKDFLPNPLVENRQIYGILSKGIHELSEEDCLSMFPSLELGIEIILDWKLAEKEKQEKENRLKSFISDTIQKFK